MIFPSIILLLSIHHVLAQYMSDDLMSFVTVSLGSSSMQIENLLTTNNLGYLAARY